jgi:hypothetical protein
MMRHLIALSLALLCACSDSYVPTDNGLVIVDDGDQGVDMGADQSTGPDLPENQFEDCPVSARPIYVVDQDRRLSVFEPDKLAFRDVTTLGCRAQSGATPFSMSVDRQGTAWVLYSSGEIFLVDTTTGVCESTTWRAGTQGFEVFGMGFVLREQGDNRDVLYVAGGAEDGIAAGASTLGQMNIAQWSVGEIDALSGWPELTGTALGELWAFFPDGARSRVSRVSRTTGAEEQSFPLSVITGSPNAWAFAFWGGDFWIFYKSSDDDSSKVYRLRPQDGSVSEVIADSGRYIVGAGVSTCAPIIAQ